jgi:hypothetical protein
VRGGAVSSDVLAKLLTVSRNTAADPILLDADRVIDLAVGPEPKVRDAARSYLRAPGVASDAVVRRMEAALSTRLLALRAQPVPGKPYHKDYLLLIAARDVYYNLGLQKLETHLQALQAGRRADLAPVLAIFEQGRKLRALTTPREAVSLSKNTYGLALAQFRSAALAQAIESSGKSPPGDFITKAKLGALPLSDTASAQAFKALLEETRVDPSLYPWPPHLEQAKRCAASLTYACFGGDTTKE